MDTGVGGVHARKGRTHLKTETQVFLCLQFSEEDRTEQQKNEDSHGVFVLKNKTQSAAVMTAKLPFGNQKMLIHEAKLENLDSFCLVCVVFYGILPK
mgnify:CR=1 FL=1